MIVKHIERVVGSLIESAESLSDVFLGLDPVFDRDLTAARDERHQNDQEKKFHSFHFFGSFCFNFSTGSKISPCFSTRPRTLSERNLRRSAFFFFKQLATSSQVTGVETVGSSLARRE